MTLSKTRNEKEQKIRKEREIERGREREERTLAFFVYSPRVNDANTIFVIVFFPGSVRLLSFGRG